MRSFAARLGFGIVLMAGAGTGALQAQSSSPGFMSPEEIVHYSPDWTGERFPDGRPKVPDAILDRMRHVTLEEAWATLRSAGFNHQYEDGWISLFPDKVLVGRALTAQWVPGRPDIQKVIEADGSRMKRIGEQNAWPVDMLQPRDVYVADHFGLKQDGPSIGDNVGNAIYARTGNGIVYDGALRDVEGLKEIGGFTSFYTSYDPSYHNPGNGMNRDLTTMLVGINHPTRIRTVTVMPGDVVLGKMGVVVFIPPQLAELVVKTSEIVRLRDQFGHQRLREGIYTAGQIDTRWSDEIEKDFSKWLNDHINELPVGKEQIQALLKERTW